MKLVAFSAIFFVIGVSSIHAEPDIDGDKIPSTVVLAAVKNLVDDGIEFIAVDDVVAAVGGSDNPEGNPLFRKLFKKCHNGDCRKKCNAKGKNGACVWFKCVCWK